MNYDDVYYSHNDYDEQKELEEQYEAQVEMEDVENQAFSYYTDEAKKYRLKGEEYPISKYGYNADESIKPGCYAYTYAVNRMADFLLEDTLNDYDIMQGYYIISKMINAVEGLSDVDVIDKTTKETWDELKDELIKSGAMFIRQTNINSQHIQPISSGGAWNDINNAPLHDGNYLLSVKEDEWRDDENNDILHKAAYYVTSGFYNKRRNQWMGAGMGGEWYFSPNEDNGSFHILGWTENRLTPLVS